MLNNTILNNSEGQQFPLVKDLPWLFADPDFSFREWGVKSQQFINQEKTALKILQQGFEKNDNPLQKSRLQKRHQGRLKNLAYLEKTLTQWLNVKPFPLAPSTQQINSYFDLIFRDWCWQSDELESYVNFASSHIDATTKHIVILGSGAGGLSYHLAQAHTDSYFLSVEHNPFLALTAEHIFAGKALKLFEVNNYPKALADSAVKWEIKQEKLTVNNHQTVLCAFPQLPLPPESIDMIIAPWFLDILDISFPKALHHCLSFLKPDGKLLYVGPSNIHKKSSADQLCHEEIVAYVSQYFADCAAQQQACYYLDSPYKAQRRLENVSFIAGSKLVKRDDTITSSHDMLEIKYSEQLQQYQRMVFTHTQLLSHIQSDMSLTQLAQILEQELGFEAGEAGHYAKIFAEQILANAYRS